MRKTTCLIFFLFIAVGLPVFSQVKKLLSEVDSKITREVVSFKYNNKNQLIYFDEKGTATYREFTLKYNKADGKLSECIINQERGEVIYSSKFSYNNPDYITEEVKNSGKKINIKSIDENKIYIDKQERLLKTMFDEKNIWEEFEYDRNNNVVKYIQHSAQGDSDVITTKIYSDKNTIFINIENIPVWFWALLMNNMRWCNDFVGKNIPSQTTVVDQRFGTEVTKITYDYDDDGYPIRQYYNNELVKEFKYRVIK